MRTATTRSEVFAQALGEHTQIFPTLIDITRGLDALDAADPDPADFARLSAQARSLRTDLAAHFSAEERAKLLAQLAAVLPDAGAEIERLEGEHESMLARLDAALSGADACTPLAAERLSEGLSAVLDALYAHEAIEDQLMSRAFTAADPGDIDPRRDHGPAQGAPDR